MIASSALPCAASHKTPVSLSLSQVLLQSADARKRWRKKEKGLREEKRKLLRSSGNLSVEPRCYSCAFFNLFNIVQHMVVCSLQANMLDIFLFFPSSILRLENVWRDRKRHLVDYQTSFMIRISFFFLMGWLCHCVYWINPSGCFTLWKTPWGWPGRPDETRKERRAVTPLFYTKCVDYFNEYIWGAGLCYCRRSDSK